MKTRLDPDEVVDVLREARAIIAAGKWCQRTYGQMADGSDSTGADTLVKAEKFCALGAVRKVLLDRGLSYEWLEDDAIMKLQTAVNGNFYSVAGFNDRPGRTSQEVVELFDKAIQLAEREVR